MNKTDLGERVRQEVEGLHRFLVEWFTGALPDSDEVFQARLLGRFDPGFHLVPPNGAELSLSALAGGLRKGHGSNPDFRIEIRDVRVRADCRSHVLATYVEWQRNALASTPPDNARLATALFSIGDSLQWIHLHETWLPRAVMEAGPNDFQAEPRGIEGGAAGRAAAVFYTYRGNTISQLFFCRDGLIQETILVFDPRNTA